jgi:hypothetical protein
VPMAGRMSCIGVAERFSALKSKACVIPVICFSTTEG